MMNRRVDVVLHSPSDIRDKSRDLLQEKQRALEGAFWSTAAGLVLALLLLLFHLDLP